MPGRGTAPNWSSCLSFCLNRTWLQRARLIYLSGCIYCFPLSFLGSGDNFVCRWPLSSCLLALSLQEKPHTNKCYPSPKSCLIVTVSIKVDWRDRPHTQCPLSFSVCLSIPLSIFVSLPLCIYLFFSVFFSPSSVSLPVHPLPKPWTSPAAVFFTHLRGHEAGPQW